MVVIFTYIDTVHWIIYAFLDVGGACKHHSTLFILTGL